MDVERGELFSCVDELRRRDVVESDEDFECIFGVGKVSFLDFDIGEFL